MSSRPRLVCITGLTASGKSALALELAEGLGAEILSVDSMQVYRGLDIGTAKPSAAEQERVRHHGIDLVEPHEAFSAGAFLDYARALLDSAVREGRTVLAVGGTGLYLRALLHGIGPQVPANPELRRQLRQAPEDLHRRLQEVDPEAAARLHPNDHLRLERALEVYLQTGETMTAWQARHAFSEAPFEARLLALRRERPVLEARIAERVDHMLQAGWIAEVEGLLARGVTEDLPAMAAIGYREIAAHLRGELDRDSLRERIVVACRRFAKRQGTWFNREPSVEWLDPVEGLSAQLLPDLAAFLGTRLNGGD